MPSTLFRLFSYAKARKSEALENFTTEALAAAIRADARPFLSAIQALYFEDGSPPPLSATVEAVTTQVSIPCGTLDMVIELRDSDGPRVLWIEIKAHSNLHKGQIEKYVHQARQITGMARPTVMMLSKSQLTTEVPTLRWDDLRQCAAESKHVYWQDLSTFLVEKNMATTFDQPMDPSEVTALVGAQAALRKTARIAERVIHQLEPKGWLDPEFPKDPDKIAKSMGTQIWRHGRAAVSSGRYPWIVFGVAPGEHAQLFCEIRFRPKDISARQHIFELAREHGLDHRWTLESGVHPRLRIREAATDMIDIQAAAEKILAWFAELEDANVLHAIPRFRKKDPLKGPLIDGDEPAANGLACEAKRA